MSGDSKKAILRQAYTELAKAEKSGDYERGFKTANRILKSYPHESTAFKCKVVCLIQLEKFDDAVLLIKKNPPKLVGDCTFEKAYCEYRLNKPAEALATLEEAEEKEKLSFASLELMAQLLYRLNRFQECQQIYKKILKESTDEFDELRGANLQAAEVQLAEVMPSVSTTIEFSSDSYEQLYNGACRMINEGQFMDALKNLKKAEELCRNILKEDEVPEDEIEDEVAVLRAQAAYCHQMLGDHGQALQVYTDIIKLRPNDSVLMAVASNNIVSLRKGEQNLFDSRKKLKATQGQKLEQKYAPAQKRISCYNNALLQLHSNQFELCRKALADLRTMPGTEEEVALIEVSLLIRQKDMKGALELLNGYKAKIIKAGGKVSAQVHFALAQLHLTEGKVNPAIEELKAVEEARWTPGVISLTVSAQMGMENSDGAIKTLKEAIEYYQRKNPTSPHIPVLMEECGSLYLKIGQQKEATRYLEDLRKLRPNDPQILARLIQAYAQFDPKKADEVSLSSPQLGVLSGTEGINVDELESSGWILMGERYRQKKEAKQTPKPGRENAELLKPKHRKKKPRLPKTFDPAIPPDPERWIPKYERTTYRKKKDKRQKDREIGRGTQGAASTNTELDSSGKVASTTPASPKAVPEGPRQQMPAGANKAKPKKKKGGNKW